MSLDNQAFYSATQRLSDADGHLLSELVADGRHALVLLRHFG